MVNSLSEVTLHMSKKTTVKGKTEKVEKVDVTCLAEHQHIYQSRIDNNTSYTERLSHRMLVTIDSHEEIFGYPDMDGFNLDSVSLRTHLNDSGTIFKDIEYGVLRFSHHSYNKYTLELAEVK